MHVGFLAFLLAACLRPAGGPGAVTPIEAPPPADPAAEAAAYEALALAYMRGDAPGALAGIAAFEKDYPGSRALGIVRDWGLALQKVGQPAPPLTGLRWRGTPGRYADHPVTLVVFFEPWCPHCQADVPQLELVRRDLAELGLGVIGLTQLSRDATEADLDRFVERGFLGFPIGIEDGGLTEAYGINGVPAVALVRGERIEWAGHPQLMSRQLLEALLAGTPLPIPAPIAE